VAVCELLSVDASLYSLSSGIYRRSLGQKNIGRGSSSMAGKSANRIASSIIMATSFTTVIFWSHSVAAEGALAIGLPSNVAKEGYASGYSYNAKTREAAQALALDYCHKAPTTQIAMQGDRDL
jgi:hypothetical protein